MPTRLVVARSPGQHRARVKALEALRKKYSEHHTAVEKKADELFRQHTTSPLFLLGLGLYWAEGAKNLGQTRVSFTNTDPSMLRFMLWWFQTYFDAQKEHLIAHMLLHVGHMHRERELGLYWQRELGIPLSAFRKTWWVRAPWQRSYENDASYHGVLTIRVRQSKDRLRMIRVWIDCLKETQRLRRS